MINEMARPEPEGSFGGKMTELEALASRLKSGEGEVMIKEKIQNPATSTDDLANLQVGIYSFIQTLDSDQQLEDAYNNLKSTTRATFAAAGAMGAIIAAIALKSLAPLGLAVKDPLKHFNHRREELDREAEARASLRAEMAQIHAAVTAQLHARNYDTHNFDTLKEPKPRRTHWQDADPEED